MSRYTGPSWRVSRRLGMSLPVPVRNWLVATTHLVITVMTVVAACLNTVCNCAKSKSCVTCTV